MVSEARTWPCCGQLALKHGNNILVWIHIKEFLEWSGITPRYTRFFTPTNYSPPTKTSYTFLRKVTVLHKTANPDSSSIRVSRYKVQKLRTLSSLSKHSLSFTLESEYLFNSFYMAFETKNHGSWQEYHKRENTGGLQGKKSVKVKFEQ